MLIHLPEHLLTQLILFLDEDTIGSCICTCKHWNQVLNDDSVYKELCCRIFPIQCRKSAQRAHLQLRRCKTWFEMLCRRPHVRYNGLYWLRISYYKKPEWNMWTPEITPGSVLQVVYYRYFYFQRDGTLLYAMLFKPPKEVINIFKKRGIKVHKGEFHVERNRVLITVNTPDSVVEFRLQIGTKGRGRNVSLKLLEHYSFSEPDRTGWIVNFDTNGEVFRYYRSRKL